MRQMKTWMAAGALFLAAGVAQAGTITNGSFETGNFTGWTVSANTLVTTGPLAKLSEPGSWSPTDGSYFARIVGDDANVYYTIAQTFTADVGDVLTFDVFFDASDYSPSNDDGFAKLIPGNTLYAQSVFTVGDFGSNGWTSVSHTFTTAGSVTLQFGVRNALDNGLAPYLGIDNVRLTSLVAVPLPAAAWMGLGTLSGFGLLAWRRKRVATGVTV